MLACANGKAVIVVGHAALPLQIMMVQAFNAIAVGAERGVWGRGSCSASEVAA